MVRLLERAAEDPQVLGIKQTIYRLAEDSRVTAALLKAAENGKHVSVLFEVKARFDEETQYPGGRAARKGGLLRHLWGREVQDPHQDAHDYPQGR
ncbi:MAG: hypothetical protein WKG07_45640 [Hymenobacter sp.]